MPYVPYRGPSLRHSLGRANPSGNSTSYSILGENLHGYLTALRESWGGDTTSHTRKSKTRQRFRITSSATCNHVRVRSSRCLSNTTGRESTQRIRSRSTPISQPHYKKLKISTVAARVESSEERKGSILKGLHNTDYESPQGNDT
jgi:hypothetical protein